MKNAKMTSCLLTGWVFLISLSTLQAQVTTNPTNVTLGLDKAIETGLANSFEIKRALLSVKDADQLENIAWAEVLPTISSDLGYTRNIEIPVNFVPGEFFGGEPGTLVPISFGTDNSWDGGFTVRQTLFRGQAFVGISTSSVFRLAQLENFRATSQQVVTRIRQAFHAVLIADEQWRLQQASIKRLRDNLKENQERANAGLLDSYEVLRLEVQLKNEEPKLSQAQQALAAAYRNLKASMGVSLNWDFQVEGQLSRYEMLQTQQTESVNAALASVTNTTPYQSWSLSQNVDLLSDFRGDLRVLDYQIKLKKREIASEKTMYFPTISATYNLRWNATESGSPDFFGDASTRARFQTLGLTASLPLFDGMRRNVNVQRAIIARKTLEEQRNQARLLAQSETIGISEEIDHYVALLPSLKEGIDLAKTGYERALARYRNGIGSQMDVTEADLQWRQAQLNYAQLVYNYLNSKARYDQAIGQVPYVNN